MNLVLDLPPQLGTELAAEAAKVGMPLQEYIIRLLSTGREGQPKPSTGAELVAFWQKEGLIGTRTDISDSSAHARSLREQAERRSRP